MPTYLDLRTRISRNLWRARSATDCEYDPDIKSAVASAIRAYQGRDFWFAEQDWRAELPTVAGQQYYPLPEDMASIRNVRVLDGDTWEPLISRSEAAIDALNAQARPGVPEAYCVINKQLRLGPVPFAALALDMTGTRTIPAPENDGDANEWTTEAFDLIAYEAMKILWATVKWGANVSPGAQAEICARLAQDALRTLLDKTNRYRPAKDIAPMAWRYPC